MSEPKSTEKKKKKSRYPPCTVHCPLTHLAVAIGGSSTHAGSLVIGGGGLVGLGVVGSDVGIMGLDEAAVGSGACVDMVGAGDGRGVVGSGIGVAGSGVVGVGIVVAGDYTPMNYL